MQRCCPIVRRLLRTLDEAFYAIFLVAYYFLSGSGLLRGLESRLQLMLGWLAQMPKQQIAAATLEPEVQGAFNQIDSFCGALYLL